MGNILANYSSKVSDIRVIGIPTVFERAFENQPRFDEYFKFSVVRNPWDRLVSVFHFLNINNESTELVAPRTRILFDRHIKKIQRKF